MADIHRPVIVPLAMTNSSLRPRGALHWLLLVCAVLVAVTLVAVGVYVQTALSRTSTADLLHRLERSGAGPCAADRSAPGQYTCDLPGGEQLVVAEFADSAAADAQARTLADLLRGLGEAPEVLSWRRWIVNATSAPGWSQRHAETLRGAVLYQ